MGLCRRSIFFHVRRMIIQHMREIIVSGPCLEKSYLLLAQKNLICFLIHSFWECRKQLWSCWSDEANYIHGHGCNTQNIDENTVNSSIVGVVEFCIENFASSSWVHAVSWRGPGSFCLLRLEMQTGWHLELGSWPGLVKWMRLLVFLGSKPLSLPFSIV